MHFSTALAYPVLLMDMVVLSLLLPRALVPDGVCCSHVGLLPSSNLQRPSFVLISAPDAHLGMSLPRAAQKQQLHEVLQPQTSQKLLPLTPLQSSNLVSIIDAK